MKFAGKVTLPLARLTVTMRSSTGWRIDSTGEAWFAALVPGVLTLVLAAYVVTWVACGQAALARQLLDPPEARLVEAVADLRRSRSGLVDAFETEQCGIDHSEDGAPEGDEEPAEGATEVEVTATDYAFELPETVAAGSTALVMHNDGDEAHFMIVERILQGTLEEALQRALMTRVRITGTERTGKIEVAYSSAEDLERLAEKLGIVL